MIIRRYLENPKFMEIKQHISKYHDSENKSQKKFINILNYIKLIKLCGIQQNKCLYGNFIALNAYIIKEESSKIIILIFTLRHILIRDIVFLKLKIPKKLKVHTDSNSTLSQ